MKTNLYTNVTHQVQVVTHVTRIAFYNLCILLGICIFRKDPLHRTCFLLTNKYFMTMRVLKVQKRKRYTYYLSPFVYFFIKCITKLKVLLWKGFLHCILPALNLHILGSTIKCNLHTRVQWGL